MIRVKWDNSKYSLRANVYLQDIKDVRDNWFKVEIMRDERLGGNDWESARINWASYGSQNDMDLVLQFGLALEQAVAIANEMNNEVRNYSVTYKIQEEDGSVRFHTDIRKGTHIDQFSNAFAELPSNIMIHKVQEVKDEDSK